MAAAAPQPAELPVLTLPDGVEPVLAATPAEVDAVVASIRACGATTLGFDMEWAFRRDWSGPVAVISLAELLGSGAGRVPRRGAARRAAARPHHRRPEGASVRP